MNLAAPNSGGVAASPPPAHQITVDILLPDGSCIPSTLSTVRKVLKQARSAALKARKMRRQEIADELQRNLEDRAAVRRLLDELAGYERDRRRMAATLRARVKTEARVPQASNVRKRRGKRRSGVAIAPRPTSSWVIDDLGMRGVHYHQSYLNRKSPSFYRGAATDRWLYDVRDEAVVRDAKGNVVWFSNLGDDIDEIAAAWQAVEDATTRKNGKVQIRIIVPLDADASPEEQAEALRHFCEAVLKPLDLPYSAVMHRAPEGGDQRNAHGHILTNLRPTERIAPYTWAFADEIRGELDGKNGVQMLRHLWAWSMTEAAEASARRMIYTGLSYAARGLPLDAGEHLGENRAAMVARGERVWAHERNRIKAARNAQRLMLRDLDQKMAALTRVRDTLVAEQDMPGNSVRQKLVAAVPEPDQPVPLREAGDSAERPVDLVSAASPRPADLVRPQPLVAAGAAPTPPSPTPQPLVAAGGVGHTPDTLQPAPPALPVSKQAFAEPTALVAAGRHRAGSLPAVLAVARAARTAPPPIIETMHETLRRLASKRRARPVDPAVTALRRRRALASEVDRFASARVILERSWLDLNPLTPFTTATRQRARDRDRERLTRIAAGGGYVTVQPSGLLTQAVRTAAEPVPTDDWWTQDHVQRPLADLRERQQRLMAQALDLSGLAPDQLVPGGPARWTIAVSVADRAKLGRWAEAPAFHADLVAVAQTLASEAGDRERQPEITAKARTALVATSDLMSDAPLPAGEGSLAETAGTDAIAPFHETDGISDEDKRRFAMLARIDPYVADYGGGMPLEIGYSMMKALGVDDSWLSQPYVQTHLAKVRVGQQVVVSAMAVEAERRPLAFGWTTTRFWPRDLPAEHLVRLDRWADDDGLEHDLAESYFSIGRAHAEHSRQLRMRAAGKTPVVFAPASIPAERIAPPVDLVPDGFGGKRDTPPPVYAGQTSPVRLKAFEADGKPTAHLLRLLHLVSEHPTALAVASDGLLMVEGRAPALLAPLVHGWRHDPAVTKVVIETVRLTREADRPTWPQDMAAAVRAFIRRETGHGAHPTLLDPSRDWQR